MREPPASPASSSDSRHPESRPRLRAELQTLEPAAFGVPVIFGPRHANAREAGDPADAKMLIDHIRWLFGDRAEEFLDWLAHLEQKPGELPVFPLSGFSGDWDSDAWRLSHNSWGDPASIHVTVNSKVISSGLVKAPK